MPNKKYLHIRPSRSEIISKLFLLFFIYFACVHQVLGNYVNFESGQVRPLAISADNSKLYVVNTPDNRLEIFNIKTNGLELIASVAVGLDPVSVALRNNNEAWVVNHLSDSVSIIDLTTPTPRVVRTLLVGDEPRDIVFAGPGHNRAFITTAHRGKN